jgi:hypothetical protein
MSYEGTTVPEGQISMRIQRSLGSLIDRPAPSMMAKFRNYFQKSNLPLDFNGKLQSTITLAPSLSAKVFRVDYSSLASEQIARLKELLATNIDVGVLASPFYGHVTDMGIVSRKTITDNGVTALAAGFAGAFTISNFKFHAFGTGTTAEAEAHANLVTELTTQYVVDNTRVTGSQANTASAGGPPQIATYTTIGTLSPDSGGTIAITEHAIFAAAAGVGGGANTMWDRSVFSAVNLVAGSDSLQVTYNLSITANG